MGNKKHSKRLKGLGFHELEVKNIEYGNNRRGGLPRIKAFILDCPDKNKKLSLRPTKGYKIESIA